MEKYHVKRIIALWGSLFFLGTGLFAQEFNNRTFNSLIAEIRKLNICEDEFVGIGNDASFQYKRFRQLQNISSNEKLNEILKTESNGVLKVYAYIALRNKKSKIDDEVLNVLVRDTSVVTYQSGCNTSQFTVSSFIKQYDILGKKFIH